MITPMNGYGFKFGRTRVILTTIGFAILAVAVVWHRLAR